MDDLLHVIKDLLRSNCVGTQAEIRKALAPLGIELNQSKISRLLRKVGAVKITNNKQIIYSLPHEPAPPTSKNMLSQLITHIDYNETLIVIRTHPGSASMIARLLDHHQEALHLLGSVAGDDTIFVTPKRVKTIQKTWQSIKTFLNGMS